MKFNPFDNVVYPVSDKMVPEKYKVERTNPIDSVRAKHIDPDKNKNHQNPGKKFNKNINLGHFKQLAYAMKNAHNKLIKSKNPYRFYIYLKGEEIMVDVVKLNALGKVGSIIKKNITREDFDVWIESIETGDGLITDQEA
ncbi:MAG: hypothetical protein JW925_07070 [Syntrophaceae bacterium]|nr:hypothetical protein [Syntrophaceae bacterium]